MNKSDLLRAYFGSNEVIVEGGFCHSTKGHEVEIIGIENNIPRQSVSVWELHYADIEKAKNVFLTCFNLTPEQARDIDRKKGIPKTPLNLLKKRELAFA
jgi:hypothetical protein